jgi:hypothetical protein
MSRSAVKVRMTLPRGRAVAAHAVAILAFAFLGGFRIWHHASAAPAAGKGYRRSIAVP